MQTLNLENAVILDTETTGLDSDARICEVSIIDAQTGIKLYSSLVNPLCLISPEVTAIHGITSDMVIDMPAFDKVWNDIKGYLSDSAVYVYNLDFDYRMFAQSLRPFDYPVANLVHFFGGGVCAMRWYAQFWGHPDTVNGGYRWQSLTNACKQQGVDVSDLSAHRALADCEMTRRLIHAVNAKIEAR
ncbi:MULTISPECIES: 3'-5' exonuclease [Vibrio]|uniref:3'-5' exonuclease n=1 Tax=Vibrio TaxID=662 RepID=UPI000B8EC496|nr:MULTISPECIES: 3'-5' exonuclease [Vibrio]MDQ2194809.1 3'-5' exonuclease [Vibrio sp. A14(2019)]MDQ2196505.1 3'-5' exonuclease [Vibrio sp. 2017_1457_11]NAW98261.1 3'-5' exonuclease [Vibrio sp. V23_P3S9T160]NNN75722.1 3'-5' exonuclease [Vibrio sp. B7]NNN92735.1 3'-5' exonuclease [Vibrio sp. B8-1]